MPRIELKKEPTLLSAALICDRCGSRAGLGIPLEDSFTKIAATYMVGAMPRLEDGGIGYEVPGVFLCVECDAKDTAMIDRAIASIARLEGELETIEKGVHDVR